MENVSNYLICFFLPFILLWLFYWYYRIPKNLPPGPLGLPLLGSLPYLGKQPYLNFIDFATKYGNVFHLYLGSTLVIVLNDLESIKEALVKQGEIFSGRNDPQFRNLKDTPMGFVHNDGEYWRQHRRFLISTLRSNGVGKHSLEPRIMNEVRHFISEIQRTCGQPVKIKHLLQYSLVNNILLLVNNTRYDYDNDKIINYVNTFIRYVGLSKQAGIQTFLPWLKNIPGLKKITKFEEKSQLNKTILNCVKEFITVKSDNDDAQGTYINAYKLERNKRLQQTETEDIFTDNGLLHNTKDLLSAGGETSANILNWIFLYLTKYPKIQLKAQEEIDRTIGRHREVTYDDRFQTPYVEAIIMETQRIASILPLALLHRNIRETTLYGYTIPTNTMIIPNLYAIHHDPKLWGDPENFRPERFFDENGQLFKPSYLIPFSMGKRVCPGESLAKMELYLYFATVLQNFHLVPTKINQSLDVCDTIARQAVNSYACFQQR